MWTRRSLALALGSLLGLCVASTAVANVPRRPAAPSYVEGSAVLRGVVTAEDQGNLLPHVSVTLRSETNQGFIRVRVTDPMGAFSFERLPAGLYSLEATRAGHEQVTLEPILILDGTTRQEHLALPIRRQRRPAS